MPQRREPRLANTLTVWVSGRDVNGNRFEQSARVVDVSRLGGRLDGIRCLRGPGETLEVRHRGRTAQFCVVWMDEGEGQVGLRSAEPEKYIWGVNIPASSAPPTPAAFPLKTATSTFSAAMPAPARLADSTATSPAPIQPEAELRQRQFPRHRCVGGIEVRHSQLQQRVWGRLAQLSEGGCYVETFSPLPADSHVELLLGAAGVEMRCKGVVCYSRPGIGMGIMFTELAEESRRRLRTLVADLAKGGRLSRFA